MVILISKVSTLNTENWGQFSMGKNKAMHKFLCGFSTLNSSLFKSPKRKDSLNWNFVRRGFSNLWRKKHNSISVAETFCWLMVNLQWERKLYQRLHRVRAALLSSPLSIMVAIFNRTMKLYILIQNTYF